MVTYRYSRWDGSQEVFPLDSSELMDRLSEQLMASGNLTAALRSLVQEGLVNGQGQRLKGIEDILERLRQQRREVLRRYNLDSVVGHVDERLGEVERLERQGIQRRLQEVRERIQRARAAGQAENEERLGQVVERIAAQNLQFLDELPRDAAARIRKLRDYEFMSAEARQRFDQLLASIQHRILERRLKGLTQRLGSMDPASMKSLTDMLRDLNRMLRERRAGQQPNLRQFREKYRHLLGSDAPATLDDLVERLQRQVAQMESLLNSMSPDMRRQLQDMLDSAIKDEDLRSELAELANNLEALLPMHELRRSYPFSGDEMLTLEEAMGLMERLQKMDALERDLRRVKAGANVGEVDSQLVLEVMGQEALQQLEGLRSIVQSLEEAGYITRVGNRFELTPRGMRKLGQRALAEIFAYIKRNGAGDHATRTRGDGGEVIEETRKYEYGDAFRLDLQRSLMNALERQPGGPPLHLRPEDFEVYQSEHTSRSSTVLMIDLSLSMAMRGNFPAAKKVALALNNLIRTRFPHDVLYVVGFSTYAREVKPEALPYLTWDEFDPYTNIQHGLLLAQQLLARGSGTKQVIMVSDGEPTAHVEAGQLYLQYPPSARTLEQTLREVKRCADKGIIINTFMLDQNIRLIKFVEKMTRLSRGRVFYTTPERLGQYVLVDYFASRRQVFR